MIRGYATISNLELNIEHGKKLQPHEKEMVKNIIGGVGYKSYNNLFEVGNVLELSKINTLLDEFFEVYLVDPDDCTLLIMHRRWLNVNEFTTDLGTVAQTIDNDLAKEIYSKDNHKLAVQRRIENEQVGRYNGILMDNYGEEIIEVENLITPNEEITDGGSVVGNGEENIKAEGNVLGYKIFEDEGIVVKDIVTDAGDKA